MGNNSSSSQQDRIAYQNFVANYAFVKKVKDPRYGEISILEDKTSKEHVALKEILCKSTTDFNREIEELKQRCKISHPNVIRLIAYTSKAEDNLCASFYKILLILDYLEHDLDSDINAKKARSEYYTEEQLWCFLESVLNALLCLQSKGVAHGDLKPSNIFMSKAGAYKVAEQSLLGNVMPSYALRLSGFDDVRAYLSPALVQNLARQELYPRHDPFKSDVFTLGLSVLHAATLTDCDGFYDWDHFSLDVEALQRRVAKLALKYSEQFQRFLGSMLTLDESKRPSASDLFNRIPSQDDLLKKELAQAVAQNGLRTITTDKKPQSHHSVQMTSPEVADNSSHGDEGSVRVRAVSVKLPSYSNKTAPEEPITQVETLGNQLNVRMGVKPSVLKRDFEPSPIKPLEEPSNDKLRAPETDPLAQSQKATFTQFNSRVNTDRMETSSFYQYEYAQPVQTQPSNSQQRVEPYGSNYRPADDIVRILNEYRNKDSVSQNTTQNRPETVSYSQSAIGRSESGKKPSYSVLPNTNTQPDFRPLSLTGGFNTIANINAVSPLSTTAIAQNTQQQQTPIYNTNTSHYKPSADIERILQDIRNRNIGVKTTEPNLNTISTNNSGTTSYTPSLNSLATHGNPVNTHQPSPVYNNMVDTYSYTPYHQTTGTQPQQQVISTAATTINQTEGFTKTRTPTIYPTKTPDQTQQAYLSNQRFERYATAFEYPNRDLTDGDRGSYGNTGGTSNPTNYSTFNGYSYPSTTQTTQPEEKNPQSTQKENFQPQYEKENYNKTRIDTQPYGASNGTKIEYSKQQLQQQAQTTQPQQQQGYTSLSNNSNPLQPLSSNTQHHRRQSSSSFTRPQYNVIETITEQYADGSVYEGQKQGNFRHGKGKFYYSDGGLYNGDWKAGSMDGYGTLYYGGGQIAYEGDWKDDKFHGKGTVYNEIPEPLQKEFDYANFDNLADYWVKYEGGFLDDNKEGFGVLCLSNGDRFEGSFKDDMVHGKGTYIFGDRQRFTGEWWNNRLV